MRNILITISIILMFPLSAMAEKWTQYWESAEGSLYYYDLDSIEQKGDMTYYWEKVLPCKKMQEELSTDPNNEMREFHSYNIIDCNNKKIGYLKIRILGDEGKLIHSEDVPENSVKTIPVSIDGPLLKIYDTICKTPSN